MLILQRVHALPEALMPVGHQLPLGGESLQRFPLPHRLVPVDIIEDLGLEDEERAIDPAVPAVRLLLEAGDAISVELEAAEPSRRPYRGPRGELAVGPVEKIGRASCRTRVSQSGLIWGVA